MATRKQVEARLTQMGCTLDEDASCFTVDAPEGKVFNSNGLHCYVVPFKDGGIDGVSRKTETYDDILEMLGYGLDDCDDPNCEYCH